MIRRAAPEPEPKPATVPTFEERTVMYMKVAEVEAYIKAKYIRPSGGGEFSLVRDQYPTEVIVKKNEKLTKGQEVILGDFYGGVDSYKMIPVVFQELCNAKAIPAGTYILYDEEEA